MTEKYTKARFWKCALQVNPADYIKYRGTDHGMTEEEYNQALLHAALRNDIKVIGLADHGNVDAVDEIRQLMNEHGIIVFPGFEISSSEKAHFVCLFPENTPNNQLHHYLMCLFGVDHIDNVTQPSKLGAEKLLKKVEELGGFAFAAHCTEDNGVLQRRLNHVWTSSYLKAAQIPGPVEHLKNIEDGFYYHVIRNKKIDYRRNIPIGIINSGDVAYPKDLEKPTTSCLIKMTRPCFESFKLAFHDPESRVRLNSDVPEKYYSRIESIKIIGGYLDDLEVDFSEHLNTVIGGRGTGKSTLIECIRYALDLQPIGKESQKQHQEVIKENLGKAKARVELSIRSSTMNGRRFIVSRNYGQSPMVKDEEGQVLSFMPTDLLPRIEIYGQNEIYEIAKDVNGQWRLLERFLEQTDDEKIGQVVAKLAKNRAQMLEAQEKIAAIEDDIARLDKLEENVKQYRKMGLEEKLQIVPKLEKEKQLEQRVQEEYSNLESALSTVQDSLPDAVFLSNNVLDQLPHKEILQSFRTLLDTLKADTEKALAQIRTSMETHKAHLTVSSTALYEAIQKEEAILEKTFKALPSSEGRSGKEIGLQFQGLLQEIERIRPRKTLLANRQNILTDLRKTRHSLLDELSSLRATRNAQFTKTLIKLNKKLDGKLKLSITPESNRQPLVKYILDCNLEGIGEKRLEWLKTAEDFSPLKLSEFIAAGEDALKKSSWNITPSVAGALARLSLKQQLEIQEIELPDSVSIELNVAHQGEPKYRPLDKLSTGQQCTAVLHLLLLENKDPLIMDQPEDNLDNAFIAERIVTELRSAKIARQFLFATHNANIPVFGDAEWIGVFSAKDDQGELSENAQGAIDMPEIRKRAAEILEGGEEAFNQRKLKYQF